MTKRILIDKEKVKQSKKMQIFLYVLLFLILFIPNIYAFFFAADLQDNMLMKLSYLALSLLVWTFPLVILNTKTYFRIGAIFLLLSPIEIGFVKTTGLPINLGLMETILNTNFNEAKEQILSNIPFLGLMFLLFAFYIYLLSFISKNTLPKTWKLILIGGFVMLNSFLYYNMYSMLGNNIPLNDRLQIAYENTVKKYRKVFPTNIIMNGIYAAEANKANKAFEKEIEKFKFHAKQNTNNQEDELYILVIGETARRHNFQLYGYERPTTPNLEKTKNIIPFSDVNSPATLTLLSLPQIITRANPDQFDLQFKEKSILDAFSEAGYYTAWIGVQNISTSVVKRLKSVADYTYFSQSDISSGNFYDADILKNVKQIVEDKKHKKKFIVIHTLGSHFRYSNRYTPEFEKFTPTISKSGYSNLDVDHKKEIVNSYDNSILYTDFFLSSLIKEIGKDNPIAGLIYLSDHGENLYDDNKTIFHGGEKPTRYEYQIPYIVWYSNKYQEFYPKKIEAMQNNKNKKAISTATFYSLLDMANVSYTKSNEEINKSLLNENYKEPLKRKIVNSKKEIIFVD